jgi:hypothetical protein
LFRTSPVVSLSSRTRASLLHASTNISYVRSCLARVRSCLSILALVPSITPRSCACALVRACAVSPVSVSRGSRLSLVCCCLASNSLASCTLVSRFSLLSHGALGCVSVVFLSSRSRVAAQRSLGAPVRQRRALVKLCDQNYCIYRNYFGENKVRF